MNYQDIITLDPGKRGGKSCIRGMRITVYEVVSYLSAGMTSGEIVEDFPYLTPEDFPYLTPEDVRACLSDPAERVCA